MNRKVAIYARVSTEHEAQLSALDNQVQYYDDILEKHPNWILYDRYIDEGITGTSIKKRKNFIRMMKDAHEGKFDLIITREVSRFARNTVDTLQQTRELKRIGVEVYFTEDNIWTFNDDDGELKLTIMATLAQNESKKTSQRVKAGQKISFENGVFYGTGNILGYDKVGKDMIINPEQGDIVKFIFDSYLHGNGTTTIKYDLERKGFLTATGKKTWSAGTITRILQNPFYCGTIIYRKCYVADYLEQKARKNNGEVEQVIIEGRHEPLISKEDFEKVQSIISKHSKYITNKRKCGHGKATSVWSKKLVCKCGSTFNRRIYHRNVDSTTYCYQCYNQKNTGFANVRKRQGVDLEGACGIPSVQEWKLTLIANNLFSRLCNDKERIIKIANKLIETNIVEEQKEDNGEVEIIDKKIETHKFKLSKLLDLFLADTITKEEYTHKKKEVEDNIAILNKRKEDIIISNDKPENNINNKISELKKLINNILYDSNSNISDKMIDGLINKVEVDDDKFTIKLNCGSNNDEATLITKFVITKDDITRFVKENNTYKKLRIKKPIIVDICI